jgi:hypothetical protein
LLDQPNDSREDARCIQVITCQHEQQRHVTPEVRQPVMRFAVQPKRSARAYFRFLVVPVRDEEST